MRLNKVVVVEGGLKAEVLQQGDDDREGFELRKFVSGTTTMANAERHVREGIAFLDQVQVKSVGVKSANWKRETHVINKNHERIKR